MGKNRSGSSSRWLQRQRNDDYVRRAAVDGYRSRAAYKLLEIHERDDLLKRGMIVVDLGAAPGGWSQVAAELVGSSIKDSVGMVFAVDLLPIDPINGVDIIQGDFSDEAVYSDLMVKLKGSKVDLVISDMAPNISGIGAVDIPRALGLAELALDFAKEVLVEEGCFLVKLFQGQGFTEFVAGTKELFKKVVIRKPKASRSESREVYILATGFVGHQFE